MKNIENNQYLVELTFEETQEINGGQCDCESGGQAFAKAVKAWWASTKKAAGEFYASPSYIV